MQEGYVCTQGYLWKMKREKKQFTSQWAKRFYRLENGCKLRWYRNSSSTHSCYLGVIDISELVHIASFSKDGENAGSFILHFRKDRHLLQIDGSGGSGAIFEKDEPIESLLLKAEDVPTMQRWVRILLMQADLFNNGDGTRLSPQVGMAPHPRIIHAPTINGGGYKYGGGRNIQQQQQDDEEEGDDDSSSLLFDSPIKPSSPSSGSIEYILDSSLLSLDTILADYESGIGSGVTDNAKMSTKSFPFHAEVQEVHAKYDDHRTPFNTITEMVHVADVEAAAVDDYDDDFIMHGSFSSGDGDSSSSSFEGLFYEDKYSSSSFSSPIKPQKARKDDLFHDDGDKKGGIFSISPKMHEKSLVLSHIQSNNSWVGKEEVEQRKVNISSKEVKKTPPPLSIEIPPSANHNINWDAPFKPKVPNGNGHGRVRQLLPKAFVKEEIMEFEPPPVGTHASRLHEKNSRMAWTSSR
jgi:hypothetical protein